MKDKLIIIGAGGHGKVVADIAKQNGYCIIEFLDDDIKKKSNGKYSVIGNTKDIQKFKYDKSHIFKDYDFFVAIGENHIRKTISEELRNLNIKQPVLIHPSAVIDDTVDIDEGTVVMANAVINANTKIGKGCIINTGSSVDHDCIIHDYVHISPGVHIAGTVHIGEESWLGISSTISNNLTLCNCCILGAGSVVIKNIVEKGTYVGIPARKIK